ncbi:MAG: hypothetical protein FWD40_11045 [Treponema sp.]|nr:hypothetical protein [Treponema sp.]
MSGQKQAVKKSGKFLRFLLVLFCILAAVCLIWIAFSMIGRVNAASIIPDSAQLRISISNPAHLLDGILSHESLEDISAVPAFAPASSFFYMLQENDIHKHGLLRLAIRGNLELALLPDDDAFAAAWDMRLLSPLLRIIPFISRFVHIPGLYYVQAGTNSRFEFRLEDMTLYIGPHRNLLFITDNSRIFESRSVRQSGGSGTFSIIKPSSYDAALVISGDYISVLLAEMDSGMAELLNNIDFDSRVEAGISIYPRKIEFRLAAPLTSRQTSINSLLAKRSRVPGIAERIPSSAQYATVLSAGTLEELYQTALVFTQELDEALRTADSASRLLLRLSLNDLLFSWSGNEFAAFGLEGRPHPVYAIQIADRRRQQEIFDRAFKSIVLNENVRLNLDGTRIPQIEVPEFLQTLLRKWDINLPSPYYIIHGDYLLASESAETLLASLRAMQRNEVLPASADWRNIAGGKSVASSFSLYYSLDLSMPFFLRENTTLASFIALYRQGLARMSIDRGLVDITLSLVPGSGGGVTLVNGYPLAVGGRPSNRIYGSVPQRSRTAEGRIFFSSGGTAVSLDISNNNIYELEGQGTHWIIPADGVGARDANMAWVVTDRGRVTLADANLETADSFPLLTGMRISSPPAAYRGRLYLCGEDGKVRVIDEKGGQSEWETSFDAALRSPPSFLTVTSGRENKTFAAVYPKSFYGEIWLLDLDGKVMPNWPVPIAIGDDEDSGIGFGSPLLFAHNGRVHVAFVDQAGLLLVYDENAELVKPFPLGLNGVFFIQPVFDGVFLWLASSDGDFFRIGLDGEVLYQNIPGFSVREEGYITVFDSNGDNIPEVYITGEGNALHAYTRNFRSLENFPLPVWGRPYFIPAQGGRKAEIFGMGMSMRLYRWQFR